MTAPASKTTKKHPVSYSSLRRDADTIETIVQAALDYIGNEEPIRSPLLNLRGALSQLRDSIDHAEGQER